MKMRKSNIHFNSKSSPNVAMEKKNIETGLTGIARQQHKDSRSVHVKGVFIKKYIVRVLFTLSQFERLFSPIRTQFTPYNEYSHILR